MKIAILDDYADVVRHLDCFKTLRGHEVTILNEHIADLDALAERVRTPKRWSCCASARRSARRCSSGCRA